MEDTFLFTAGLCMVCLLVRTGYELLKKARKVETKNKAIFSAVFVAMCLTLASWPVMCPEDPCRVVLPGLLRWSGLVLVLAALLLAVGGLVQLKGVENIDHLVTTGLFSWLRHPMYIGFTLWIVGWIVFHGAVVSLAVGLVCIGNILYWRQLEEAALEARYGEDYRVYRRATRF